MTETKHTFYIHTLGCKVNWCDSDTIVAAAEAAGWQRVTDMYAATLCVLNTCTVTSHADATARKIIRRMARENPAAPRIIVGCYARTDSSLLNAMPEADIVVATYNESDVIAAMNSFLDDLSAPDISHITAADRFSRKHTRTRGFVKIHDGCDQYCSYCKVPYARGTPRSVPPDDIIEAIRAIAEKDTKECVLTGINIGRYSYENDDLASLIRRIDKESILPRLRLSSVEPQACTDTLLNAFRDCQTLLPHMHIPVQSGSEKILRAMNRPVDRAQIDTLLHSFLSIHPLATVSTDCMVGFPGETDEDFNQTLSLIDSFPFCKVHVFRFSPRPGTAAEKMTKERIPERITREREEILIKHADKAAEKCREAFKNQTFSVLVEEKQQNEWYGYTENYLRIATTRDDLTANTCVQLSPRSPHTRFVYPS